ncbi:MAG TPA: DUF6152 family protein [Vicinamibacterales bacterium]|nr:DUF6152 family protein [Vicinamibacterales bacterium]
MRIRILLALGVAAALAAPLSAHHSFAAEYGSEPANLKGAVTKIEWHNPHVFFYIDVRDEETGKVTNWALEMGAPAVIQRNGWTRTTMKIGDMVIVTGTRAKNGKPLANARTVIMASTGKKLGAGSSEGAIP